MCERGVDHHDHRRIVVGTARHGLARSFELALAFVSDFETESTVHLYHATYTGLRLVAYSTQFQDRIRESSFDRFRNLAGHYEGIRGTCEMVCK